MDGEADHERIHAYRKQGLTDEVIETEKLWRLVNFMCCVHQTKFVRKLEWSSFRNLSRVISYECSPLQLPYDQDFLLLSKLLKCITFVQDMNHSTKISEVLGDKAEYVVNKALGKPIFTGSSEEGLALFGNKIVDSQSSYDRLDYKVNHDFDIMYESKKMVAYEIDSLALQPIDASGILKVIIRPGKKAGYVTLQKLLPRSVAVEFENYKIMIETAKTYPKPEEYVGEEFLSVLYIQVLAFLLVSEMDFLPRECGCESAGMGGLNPNRYGDLCTDCKRLTLREIPRGQGKTPTKIWSDSIKIRGPAIQEYGIIENVSDPTAATAPMSEAEFQEQYEELKKRREKEKNRPDEEPDATLLPTVKPELGDVFSSSERKMFFVDHVPAVKSVKWPSAAWEFTVRERPSGWPPKKVIQEIVAQGCHVVPRSTKPPPSTKFRLAQHLAINASDYMDWRLSFSLAEKVLISTLNTTQVKCFMLLKILNEVVTERFYSFWENDDDLFDLHSYCLKTVFFWVCEELPLDEWKDDNLGACLFKVVQKLILLLEKGSIPNYFIPSSNLILTNNQVNQVKRILHVCELASYFHFFRSQTSEVIFEVLHKYVWNELWSQSEIKPPGCTPHDLNKVIEALKQDRGEKWSNFPWHNEYHASKHFSEDPTVSSCRNDLRSVAVPNANHKNQPKKDTTCISDNFTGSNECRSSVEEIPTSGKTTDDQCLIGVVSCDSKQKASKLDQVLAQMFLAISKFLRENGNIHGKGINTARAEFYEEEARKLLPEGCSLDDLPEYKCDESSTSSSCYDSSPSSSDSEF